MLKKEDFNCFKELNYINAILHSIMNMDTSQLYNLLDDDIDYEDIGKIKFIEKLNDTFNDFKTLGDSELILNLDYCKGCNCNSPVCKFIGNYSGKQFALYFDIEDDFVKDIYHCNWYGDKDGDDEGDYPF